MSVAIEIAILRDHPSVAIVIAAQEYLVNEGKDFLSRCTVACFAGFIARAHLGALEAECSGMALNLPVTVSSDKLTLSKDGPLEGPSLTLHLSIAIPIAELIDMLTSHAREASPARTTPDPGASTRPSQGAPAPATSGAPSTLAAMGTQGPALGLVSSLGLQWGGSLL